MTKIMKHINFSYLLFNVVYGFDNIPNKFSIKYSLTAWLAWDINF